MNAQTETKSNSTFERRARNGKIARLPGDTRHELNERLFDGQSADSLLPWLNSDPDVKEILETRFQSVPISKQNLSQWRRGGYREWLTRKELHDQAAEVASHSGDLENLTGNLLIDDVATVLSARYGSLLARWHDTSLADLAAEVRTLNGLNTDIVRLQRSLHRATRQNYEMERRLDKDALKEEQKEKQTQMQALLEHVQLDQTAR